jgi:light-regulated signal transduction histidine kinase (bacteriophytochrome)
MLRVERANTNLAQLNSELESRVAMRTAELQSANQQLALTNQELEAFTASASHDLRSPLGAIAGQAGLLRDELQSSMSETIRCRIDRIQSCVRRSSDIIDGLLSLAAHLAAGAAQRARRPVGAGAVDRRRSEPAVSASARRVPASSRSSRSTPIRA